MHVAVDSDVFKADKFVFHACLIEPLGNADVKNAMIGAFGGDGKDANVLHAGEFVDGLLLHIARNFIRPIRFFF